MTALNPAPGLCKTVGEDMNALRLRLFRELPYPLGPETAAAVEAAQKRGVETWGLLAEGEVLEEWVRTQYVREGRIKLPWGAHIPFVESAPSSSPRASRPRASRCLSKTRSGPYSLMIPPSKPWSRWRTTRAVAWRNVTDAAFDARTEALWAALTGLVKSARLRPAR